MNFVFLPSEGTGLGRRIASDFGYILDPRAQTPARATLACCREIGKTPRDITQPSKPDGVGGEADVFNHLCTPPAAPSAPPGGAGEKNLKFYDFLLNCFVFYARCARESRELSLF